MEKDKAFPRLVVSLMEHGRSTVERVESDSTSPLASPHKPKIYHCPDHVSMEVGLYCDTCADLICWKCIKKGSKHHSHEYEELNDATDKCSNEIMLAREPLEKQQVIIEETLAEVQCRYEEISNQMLAMETGIFNTFRRLQESIDARKAELISHLTQLTKSKLKRLTTQSEKLRQFQAQIKSCLHAMNSNTQANCSQGELILSKRATIREIRELTSSFHSIQLHPTVEPDMMLVASADVAASIHSYGQILATGSPDPSKCLVTGTKAMEEAAVEEKSTAYLQTFNFNNQPCSEAVNSITCELVSDLSGMKETGSVERTAESNYEISYRPTVKGRHKLIVKLDGQHVRGSPFPVTAKLPVKQLGMPILTVRGVRTPEGVVINHKGEIVVTERHRDCVSVFNKYGVKLKSFGSHGTSSGQFKGLCGLTVDGDGNILIADLDNHRVQKFTADGEFLVAVGTKGNGPLQFHLPIGITYNASNDKIYVADWSGRIQILNPDLSFVSMFGKEGSGKGQFDNPQHLACDSTGNVYVADCENHRIQVFTPRGKLLRAFGRHGAVKGHLTRPSGLAIDSSNRVYVSELGNSRISIFTSEGVFVTAFGKQGTGAGEFDHPSGLAVDRKGLLYVCDYGNNSVHIL